MAFIKSNSWIIRLNGITRAAVVGDKAAKSHDSYEVQRRRVLGPFPLSVVKFLLLNHIFS
jgi:hypothetical protein